MAAAMPRECPYCDQMLAAEEIRFVAAHPELLGDPVLGDDWPIRFLPVRFNAAGDAIDPSGMPTAQLACPHCRAVIPRQYFHPTMQHACIRVSSRDAMLAVNQILWGPSIPEQCVVEHLDLPAQPPNTTEVMWHQVQHGDVTGLLAVVLDPDRGDAAPAMASVEKALLSLVSGPAT